MKDMQRQEDKF